MRSVESGIFTEAACPRADAPIIDMTPATKNVDRTNLARNAPFKPCFIWDVYTHIEKVY